MERPELHIRWNKLDYVFEIITLIGVTVIWGITFWFDYADTYQLIPTHYDIQGNATSYDDGSSLFFNSIFVTASYLLLSWLAKYPHKFNYPSDITSENAYNAYKAGARLVRSLKFSVVFIFLLISVNDIFPKSIDSGYMVLGILVLIKTPIILFLTRSSR